MRRALRWLVIVLALVEGGWLAFDGGRALLVGDYVTPRSGAYAGQLGPWAGVVTAVGLEPRSTLVKSAHVVLGLSFLLCAALFALRVRGGWAGLAACAALGLVYLPFGTILGGIQLVLLLLPAARSPAR